MQINIFNRTYGYGALTYDTFGIEDQLPAVAVNMATMLAINAAGGVKAWSTPKSLTDGVYYHNTGGPIIFKSIRIMFAVGDWSTIPQDAVTFDFELNGTPYQAYVDESGSGPVELPLYRETANTPEVTLTADEIKGVATFDVSAVVGAWYSEPEQYPVLPYIWEAVDTSVRFRTYGLEEAGQFTTYLCVRGVNEPGATNDGELVTSDVRLLTRTRQFAEYGHLTLKATAVFGNDLTYTAPGIYYTFQAGHVYHIGTPYWTWLNNQDGVDEPLEQLGTLTCEPLLSVQWLNQHGGVESYVFKRLQTYERTAKTSDVRMRYNDYTRTDISISEPYGLEYSKRVTCGAENLTDRENDILQELAVSPHIITPAGDRLELRLAVSDYQNKEASGSHLHDYEITFDIPVTVLEF